MTKLTGVLAVVVTSFILPWPTLWLSSAALLISAFWFRIGWLVLVRYVTLSLPFTVAVFVFHGLVLPKSDTFRAFGWLPYSPFGLEHAAIIGGRISLMLAASLLFVTTTAPATLLGAFDTARWPPALSFLLASPLLLIDQFAVRANAIRDAQQTRGLAIGGSVTARLGALRMLFVPLLTSALSDAQERAQVLNARGFRALPYRTVVNPPADNALQRWLRLGLFAVIALELGYLVVG
ncbi:energy-coupling factor transport system permease protein [Pararhizobium capsulatum DSM 1112]|uniref:Energy-coupling factor transport system permease protein n=1 Tax=Pararhizobium capsulatum DSM 1112 TaxID=1121113 RepID=A0ABU0BUQ7_9HYPH|nr:energy-coupling factor transport system permease protein [Pararhizobium capsulatum DSM 1112]